MIVVVIALTKFYKAYRILCHSERAKRVEESSAYQRFDTEKILRLRIFDASLRMTPLYDALYLVR